MNEESYSYEEEDLELDLVKGEEKVNYFQFQRLRM